MGILHGAIVYLIADGKRIAKANNVEVDQSMQVDTSNPIGTYHHQEIFYTGVELAQVSFDMERRAAQGMVAVGLWPDSSNDLNIQNFKPITLEVQAKDTGETLHRIKDFLPTRKPLSFMKGQKAMYRVTGQGLKVTEEDA